MFAYCNNNPVNRFDLRGKYSDSISGWIGEKLGQFIYECISNSEYGEKIDATVDAVVSNLEISAGIGMGIRLAATLLEVIGADFGVSCNMLHIVINDQHISAGQRSYSGVTASLFFLEFGESETGYRNSASEAWGEDPFNETLILFDVSGYFFAGGSLSIYFYLNSFFEDFDKIWFDN
jgi:hypothetical protein